MSDDVFDILIIGGGINGTAIARDASGAGLSVVLCERDDLAQHTSSSSTKLIHGGLRYLEYYEFRLVREALKEREVLLRSAPHIIWPMRFVLPYDEGLRPAWMLRLGLLIYDNIGGRKMLPGTETVQLNDADHKNVLQERLKFGYEYSDCWVEDSRLVVLNALDAQTKGAKIFRSAEVKNISTVQAGYSAEIHHGDGRIQTITARAIVNSAGPWVDSILKGIKPDYEKPALRLVKGSHIVTKKLFDGEHAYIFQNDDNRIIFAIPYEHHYTLIGTTDVPYSHEEGPVKISQDEIDYLCEAASEYFANEITSDDVQWTYSGVRPLYDDRSDDASAVTRDYVLDIEEFAPDAPFMSIYGGKITTSRKLAEHAMEKLSPFLGVEHEPWTAEAHLPGGDIPDADFDDFFEKLSRKYPWLEAGVLHRLTRSYGTKIHDILGKAQDEEGLGQGFGAGLYESEVRYLIENEWVEEADDVIWRRTKLGIHMNADEIQGLTDWFKQQNIG